MSDKIQIAKKFEPLFDLLNDDKHKGVDTVILTGGRMSSKSFNVALLTLIGIVEKEWKVLYSRFTNTSIGDSIKAEVSDKVELLNYESLINDTVNRLECHHNEGLISFKGIKTGSKGQTANLKSLSGFNVFVVDEAEEIPSLDTFEKVYLSIRSAEKRNLSILILNPSTKDHWIYQEYFEGKVKDGFCGVHDNVLHIHSSYLDVNPDYVPENIKKKYESLKVKNPTKYNNIVDGGWIDEEEGAVFKKSAMNWYDGELNKENAEAIIVAVDPAGDGTDSTSAPFGYLIGKHIYIDDVVFNDGSTGVTIPMIAEKANRIKPEIILVEKNFGNGMYKKLLEPNLNDDIMVLDRNAKGNKHSRIITLADFVTTYFYFRSDYEYKSEYYYFIKELTAYLYDAKENEHDDAPDSIHMFAKFIRSQYAHLYEIEDIEEN